MSARSLLVRQLPCVACHAFGYAQATPTEEHHLNKFGLAGKERRGDEFSIPLCAWHHRGVVNRRGIGAVEMRHLYGPSLARQSKKFRETYGNDDQLLAITNDKLRSVA